MYISAFHINGFGIFHDAGCEGLKPGLSIFLGKNEAGKSTCLEFLRVMLTGYPERTRASQRSFEPINGGRPGGSLTLHWREGEMRLSRAPAAFGGLSLRSPDGASIPADELARLMGGIDRESWRRIFGFSLEELGKWDKKDNESIRDALYGASFGPGLLPPGEAMQALNRRMGKIFKARGMSQPLSAHLAELEKLRQAIGSLQKEYSQYDGIASELAAKKRLLADLSAKRGALELERMKLERRQAIRQHWEQWNIARMKLDRLAEAPSGFPEDAQARLASLETEITACARNLAEARERRRQIAARMESLAPDAALASGLAALRRLSERKASYRQAAAQIPALQDAIKRAEDNLASGLAQLGSDWTCDRIRATDRSIFSREGMEKLAAELGEARMGHKAALASLAAANGDVDLAQQTVCKAEDEAVSLPEIAAPLSAAERDSLRAAMARLEEQRRLEPRRKQALENARQAFVRSLEQAQIFGASFSEDDTLDKLLARQETALKTADEIRLSLREAEEATARADAAQAEAENLKLQYDELRLGARESDASTRDGLDAKRAALRSLRGLAANMAAEEERKKELENRIANEKTPSPVKNWALITFACLFLAGSCAIFCANWFWHIQELDFGSGMKLPINLWAAYAALFCGVVLLGGGFSAYGPERKRQQRELAGLLSRSETSSMRLAEMAAQSRQLCEQAGVTDPDPIALDAMEMLLEREKEQLFQAEHSAKELAAQKRRMDEARERAASLAAEAREKSASAQRARHRWHALMQELGIDNVPAPEGAPALFARAEAAKLAHANVAAAQNELDAFWEDLHVIEESITSMPAVADCLANAPETLSLEAAVAQTLEACGDADTARAKRQAAETALLGAKGELERAVKRQGQAYALLEELGSKLAQARHQWTKCMDSFGMSAELDPETVRAAFRIMDDCLAAEDSREHCKKELERASAELEAFEGPLTEFLEKFKLEPQIDSESKPDWQATLDRLLTACEEQARLQDRLDDLVAAAESQDDICKAREAALEEAKKAQAQFLASGGCASADEFLAVAALRDKRRNLAATLEDLEAAFAQAAKGENLDRLKAEFQADDIEKLEKRLIDVKTAIARSAEDEKEAAAAAGSLEARSRALARADELERMRQDEENLLELIREEDEQWSALALGKLLLERARAVFEKERQPRIIHMASEIFQRITVGRWRGMSLSLEDSSLMILPEHGEPVEPVNLSRGAQEQAYLAFRLAYIREHAERKEPLPVVMDEILVNFDPERAMRTAQALAGLARADGQQIFYFTCQPHMVDLLRQAEPDAPLYKVENGRIAA